MQTKHLWHLKLKEKDSLFKKMGLDSKLLQDIRSLPPKERLLEASKTALEVDDFPNEDLIEWIAGYDYRGSLHKYYESLDELMSLAKTNLVPTARRCQKLNLPRKYFDLAELLPPKMGNFSYDVGKKYLELWTKTKSRMRSVKLNRQISKNIFLVGLSLYAGEGTKPGRKVEIVNSNPTIMNLFIRFLEELGIPIELISARVKVYSHDEIKEALGYWCNKTGLNKNQFIKPLVVKSPKVILRKTKKTFALTIYIGNAMLKSLINHWLDNLDKIVDLL